MLFATIPHFGLFASTAIQQFALFTTMRTPPLLIPVLSSLPDPFSTSLQSSFFDSISRQGTFGSGWLGG